MVAQGRLAQIGWHRLLGIVLLAQVGWLRLVGIGLLAMIGWLSLIGQGMLAGWLVLLAVNIFKLCPGILVLVLLGSLNQFSLSGSWENQTRDTHF